MKLIQPLLSIAIPAYNRESELLFCLERFISQITDQYEDEIEIIICDDCTPNNGLEEVRRLASTHSFIHYRRYARNIGLEQNLIACTAGCSGEFLWIFGDDDFIEPDDGLHQILTYLREGVFDFYILNRTRRNSDLSKLISDNWMNLDCDQVYSFGGLREFCLAHGFISVIGFISVNIFRRIPFQRVVSSNYFGTMYPQLGAMLEAFHASKTLLVGRPIICHRTQSSKEKKSALGKKSTEADFMVDVNRRNAIYFSHPYIGMLLELVNKGAFKYEDIVKIPENTVINGLLVDFLLQTLALSRELAIPVDNQTWLRTQRFLEQLPLDTRQRQKASALFFDFPSSSPMDTRTLKSELKESDSASLTISVISPSYNQAEFLADCLSSVRDQTYQPLEHLVFDPGSNDGSQIIAKSFPNVTLFEEPDSGQSDALNKGFKRARGEIIAWVNSDDFYSDTRVFEKVIERFHSPDKPDIVYGRGVYIDELGNKLRDVYINKDPSSLNWRFQQEDGILQPALFMRRNVIERVGPLRQDLHYCMDYEYWIRCMKAGIKFAYIDDDFATARYHKNNKTYGMRGKSYSEVCSMLKEHFSYVNHNWLKRYAEYLVEGHDGVLTDAMNSGVNDASKLDSIYRELLLAYNGGFDSFKQLTLNSSKRGFGDTLREMNALNISAAVPCKEIPPSLQYEEGYVAYTVGNRRWAFEAKWKKSQISKTHTFLSERIASRKNDTCIIVGNGPSLNSTDLSLLRNQDVIVSNNVFLSDELMQYATYYTVVNYLVAEQSSHHLNRLEGVWKVLPYWLAYCLNPDSNTFFVDAVGRPEFSKDIFQNMSWRHTVTFFNLHLAYGLGYRKVVLIGFDHNYKQPKGVAEQEIIQNYEEDNNHFHPGYFRGKKWQAADVDMMEEMYKLANVAFLEDGREIINSTVGGKLELFPRLSLEGALGVAGYQGANPTHSFSLEPVKSLVGPYSRELRANLDETKLISYLYSSIFTGRTMIDVGAHVGSAMSPFLSKGWKIFAFEPDEKNRAKLTEWLARHEYRSQVSLDPRCVSNASQVGVAFYRSEQSTGISGLSAFHESHVEAHQVDTITLAEFFLHQPIPTIDFLKIDTEGHDLFVLQGFPWLRCTPEVIECEFEDSKTVPLGYTFHDLAQFLVNKGYTVYVSEWHPIIRYGIRHDWHQLTRYPCELADRYAWGNLLAFKKAVDEGELVTAINKLLKVRACKEINMASKAESSVSRLSDGVSKVPNSSKSASESLQSKIFPIHAFNRYSTYAQCAEWLRDNYPRIFFIGRKSIRSLRYLKGNISMVVGLVFALSVIFTPMFVPSLAAHQSLFWMAGVFFILCLTMLNWQSLMAKLTNYNVSNYSYAAVAEWLRDTHPGFFRSGRFLIRSLRFLKRNRIATFGFGFMLIALVSMPIFFPTIAVYEHYFWIVPGLFSLSVMGAIGVSLFKIQETKFLDQQQAARQMLKIELIRELKSIQNEFSQKLECLKSKNAALSANQVNLSTGQDVLAGKIEELNGGRISLSDTQKMINSKLESLTGKQESMSAIQQDLIINTGQISELIKELSLKFDNQTQTQEEHSKMQKSISENQQNLLTSNFALKDKMETLSGKYEFLVNEQNDLISRQEKMANQQVSLIGKLEQLATNPAFNIGDYQPFNRRLQKAHVELLLNEWSEKLEINMTPRSLAYLAHRIGILEGMAKGRLATSIENAVLRTLVAASVKHNSLKVLEIGTLFGIGLMAIYDHCISRFDAMQLTAIDPLDGYYGKGVRDIVTDEPICEASFRGNLATAGISADEFNLIKAMSTEAAVIETVGSSVFDVLIIDGDHSEEGVKADFENYLAAVKQGGYIIFDDYGAPEWPGVTKFVDEQVMPNPDVAFVGASWRTSVFRVN